MSGKPRNVGEFDSCQGNVDTRAFLLSLPRGRLVTSLLKFGTTYPSISGFAVPYQVNSALHPSGVAKSSTSFGWGKGWDVTSAGWQVTLCDPVWHVNSSSGVATSVSELLSVLPTFKRHLKMYLFK